MNRISFLRRERLPAEKRELHSNKRRDHADERWIPKPTLQRPISLPASPREERYVLSNRRPSRSISISLTYKTKGQKTRHHPDDGVNDDDSRYEYEYDSDEFSDSDDEGDRHKGVPVTVTSNPGRELTPAVEAEVVSRMCSARALHREARQDYVRQQRKISAWETEEREGVMAGLREEMAFLELQTQNLFAQRVSLSADHSAVVRTHPGAGSWGRWSRQGDLLVWSMVGAAEEWAERGSNGGRGGTFPLTYRGVDYNP
ncbi:hypothetical protein F4810DRAFT_691164 [Camillea tinctor]|nr:hypothetical protein F4810DRAFT_691164 [Camillea tinctor]